MKTIYAIGSYPPREVETVLAMLKDVKVGETLLVNRKVVGVVTHAPQATHYGYVLVKTTGETFNQHGENAVSLIP